MSIAFFLLELSSWLGRYTHTIITKIPFRRCSHQEEASGKTNCKGI